jgi:hypothetical protein
MKKLRFKCPVCHGSTKHVWTSKDGKTVGLRCVDGHYEFKKKDEVLVRSEEKVHPVTLVPVEEA